jgi:hypothetical protein
MRGRGLSKTGGEGTTATLSIRETTSIWELAGNPRYRAQQAQSWQQSGPVAAQSSEAMHTPICKQMPRSIATAAHQIRLRFDVIELQHPGRMTT